MSVPSRHGLKSERCRRTRGYAGAVTPPGRPRFADYRCAPWPDPELQAEAARLQGLAVIRRSTLEHGGAVRLTVDFSDNLYVGPGGSGPTVFPEDAGLRPHSRLLRLRWHGRIYALESHDPFYAGVPLAALAGVNSDFVEVLSDPNPWIAELLAGGAGVFPPYGAPAQVSPEAAAQNVEHNLQWPPPTGRFYPAKERHGAADPAPVGPGGPSVPGARPRYRHLMILSESHMLEVLSDELPRLEVLEGPRGG